MQKYHNTIQDRAGNAINTSLITVYDSGTTDLSSLFEEDETTPMANPFDVAASNYETDGAFWFIAANGKYDLKIEDGSFSVNTIEDVVLFDNDDAAASVSSFDDLLDTLIASKADLDLIVWSVSASKYINVTMSALDIPTAAEVQIALNSKVDNSRVLTDVPVNALFTDTDTVYSSSDFTFAGLSDTSFSNRTDGQVAIWVAANNRFENATLTVANISSLQAALDSKAGTSHNHDSAYEPKSANLQNHITLTTNPHNVTKSQVGLSSADNTSDANKPVSTATQAALDSKSASSHSHSIYLLADGSSDLTGSQNTLDLLPVTDATSHLGSSSKRYKSISVNQIRSIVGTPTIETLQDESLGGLVAVSVEGAGSITISLNDLLSSAAIVGSCKAESGSSAKLVSTGAGSSGFGRAEALQSGSTAIVNSSNDGSFVAGNAKADGGGFSKLAATGKGTFANGNCYSYGSTYRSEMIASAAGSMVSGRCYGYYGNSNIKANSFGSSASGHASSSYDTAEIIASGIGSFAHGYCSGTNIEALAANSVQFGVGSNNQTDSLQVGTQVRLKGTVGAPLTPHDGDVWVNNSYMYMRSNGVSCKVVNATL